MTDVEKIENNLSKRKQDIEFLREVIEIIKINVKGDKELILSINSQWEFLNELIKNSECDEDFKKKLQINHYDYQSYKLIIDSLQKLCIFPDEELKVHLIKRKIVSLKSYNWFTYYEDIIRVFERFDERIELDIMAIFCLIYEIYFSLKIEYSVLHDYGLTKDYDGTNEVPMMKIELSKFFQNKKKRSAKNNYEIQNDYDLFRNNLDEMATKITEQLYTELTSKDFLFKLFGDNIDDLYILPIFKKLSRSIVPINTRQKYLAYFEMFRLFMKHRNWKTESEYDEMPSENIVFKNYDAYRLNCVKKFIEKK